MLLVTTLSYEELGTFIRDKQVSLNNSNLIFGYDYDGVKKYLEDRLGSEGYVMGIRGRINEKSVDLLSRLDTGLSGDRAILEVNVEDDEVLTFDVQGLEDAVQILSYGLPDEMLYNQLDNAIVTEKDNDSIQVVCAPIVKRTKDIRITSLNREFILDVEGITFVRLK